MLKIKYLIYYSNIVSKFKELNFLIMIINKYPGWLMWAKMGAGDGWVE